VKAIHTSGDKRENRRTGFFHRLFVVIQFELFSFFGYKSMQEESTQNRIPIGFRQPSPFAFRGCGDMIGTLKATILQAG